MTGTGRLEGMTLIELLIVVAIVGILAVIAVPKFSYTREKAYFATMKDDLRKLATAQEAFAADNAGAYASGTVTGPGTMPVLAYSPSSGVRVEVTTTLSGWSAVASVAATPRKCGMFVSNSDPPAAPGGTNPATGSGEPMCN